MFEVHASSQLPEITITELSNSMYDVRILINETAVDVTDPETGESTGTEYVYDGNIFRTVYPLTEDDITDNLDYYLEYTVKDEPTITEYLHDLEVIDAYTLELIEEGVIE